MTLNYADFLAETGMRLALDAKPDWSILADEWFALLPEGTNFTSEDLTNAIGLPDASKPNSNNAIGAKMRTWAMRDMERIGDKKTVRIVSHSRRISVWRKK